MIHFDFSKHCTGCSVCIDSCPKECIKLSKDSHDFLIPQINTIECIECGICEKVCPYLSPSKPDDIDQHVYSAFNKNIDERRIGSSGSIMLLLAKLVIAEKGVVYGAEFIDHLKLHHTRATSFEDVVRQSKSKYLQSNTVGVYKQVRNDLQKGLKVLFVGTPCQTQALHNFLFGKKYDNLILVDFICHGVPSQVLFDKAIEKFEVENNCFVKEFSFREKNNEHLRLFKITYIKDNEDFSILGNENDFPYYCGYLKYNIFRESCYECKFACPDRISDITLGDMWGLEFKEEIKDFKKGYSLLYINSSKGLSYFDQISKDIEFSEYELNAKEVYNYAFKKHTKKTWVHVLFRFLYNRISYSQLEQWFYANYERSNFIQKIYYKIMIVEVVPKLIRRYGLKKIFKKIVNKII